jgi:hypothetical protein
MISGFDVYLVCKLDDIRMFLFIIPIFTFMFTAAYFLMKLEDGGPFRFRSGIFVTVMMCLTTAVFTPSTKQMCAIMVIPAISNAALSNEKLNELPNNIIDLANDWLKELSPKKQPQ